jgi:hypothetical protein
MSPKMTYKTRLDQLLLISIQKSNVFIDIVSREGQSNSDHYKKAKEEWETAEKEYVTFLKLMEFGQISPNDTITQIKSDIRIRIKNLAALFL